MSERPTLLDLLSASSSASDARGPQPGKVRSYDAANYTADVEPLIAPPGLGAPVLRAVPVLWPWGCEGVLAAGDLVQLVPYERDASKWATARTTPGTAPSARRNALADCVALPVWTPANSSAVAVAAKIDQRLAYLAALVSAIQGAIVVFSSNISGLVPGAVPYVPQTTTDPTPGASSAGALNVKP